MDKVLSIFYTSIFNLLKRDRAREKEDNNNNNFIDEFPVKSYNVIGCRFGNSIRIAILLPWLHRRFKHDRMCAVRQSVREREKAFFILSRSHVPIVKVNL